MTREEAIEYLDEMLMQFEPKDKYGDYDDKDPYIEAVDMAIETLQAEPVVRCKDCENLEYEDWGTGKIIMYCNHFGDDIGFNGMTGNDFCSQGKRREP